LLFLEHSAALPDEEEDPTKDFRNPKTGDQDQEIRTTTMKTILHREKAKKIDGNIVEKTSEEKTFRNILLFMNVWD